MMKQIEWYMNMIFYNVFRFDSMLHRVGNKLLDPIVRPFRFLSKLSDEEIDKAEESMFDPRDGFVSIHASWTFGTIMTLWYGSLCFFLVILICYFIQIPPGWYLYSFSGFVIGGVMGLLIDYILVLRKDNYLKYFKEFEKWSSTEKKKWAAMTTVIALLGLGIAIFSFWLLIYLDPYHA